MPHLIRSLLLGATLLCGAGLAGATTLQDFAGMPHALDEYTGKGQWTFVKIWASDCGVCNSKAHAYVDFHARHKDSDARMLGISLDGPQGLDAARAFVRRHALNYPNLLVDWEGGSALYYQLTGAPLTGTPAFLLYAPDGRLLAQQVGAVPTELLERFMADNPQAN
ncbi:MAG TPA: TlpA disulfide reductase family protein [Gammaproteobacteria bacterium]